MKKSLICFITVLISFFSLLCNFSTSIVFASTSEPVLAIVIDDFGGYSRRGVEEMLSLECPLTVAVMPNLPYTKIDAKKAHENGKEVILHMPMEADTYLPQSWYGNTLIKNYDTPENASEIVSKCLDDIPYAIGMNYHIGSGVCQNKLLMTAIIKKAQEKGKFFLDSLTSSKSVCSAVAKELGADFCVRNEFLEKTNYPDYSYAKQMIKRGCNDAKKYGYAIVIGHVGHEGGVSTAQAIKDMLPEIEKQGIKLVNLSDIINQQKFLRK